MANIWSAITTFNILYLLNLWLLDRTGKISIEIFTIDSNIESVPIFGLTLGSIATISSFYLSIIYAKDHLSDEWYNRIPPLWTLVEPTFARKWGSILIVLCILFPLAAQVHFWLRFHKWQAWSNHEPTKGQTVSFYEPISPCFLLEWDDHRYGDFSRRTEPNYKGLSYVPLYQPIIMLGLTGGVVWLAIVNGILLHRKKILVDNKCV